MVPFLANMSSFISFNTAVGGDLLLEGDPELVLSSHPYQLPSHDYWQDQPVSVVFVFSAAVAAARRWPSTFALVWWGARKPSPCLVTAARSIRDRPPSLASPWCVVPRPFRDVSRSPGLSLWWRFGTATLARSDPFSGCHEKSYTAVR